MPQAFHVASPGFRRLGLVLLLLGALLAFAAPAQPQGGRVAHLLEIEGAIGPATSDYVGRSFAEARDADSAFIVLRMDTPGGLDTSMRAIIRDILASPVPVVSYVAPSGARAASAGTFILYASHVAAMAPGTNVGAATPVQIGGGGMGSPQGDGGDRNESAAGGDKAEPQGGSALERKAVNDAVAYIRSLAELRGRNADWGEQAVRTGASLSADAALREKVIDFVARDRGELLQRLDGRSVTAAGRALTIETEGVRLVELRPNWRTRILSAITDPNVALILMLIGIYGLMFEFMNPGALYPGTIGAICLLTGLYALSALPVSIAGAALMLLGLALVTAEAFTPSFGIMGFAGVVALGLGATILIDTDVPQFQVGWPMAAGLALASAGVALVMARVALSSRRAAIVSGRESMVGARGEVIDWKAGRGHVRLQGERWRAEGVDRLRPGEVVEVTAIDGLTLTVSATRTTEAAGADPE